MFVSNSIGRLAGVKACTTMAVDGVTVQEMMYMLQSPYTQAQLGQTASLQALVGMTDSHIHSESITCQSML